MRKMFERKNAYKWLILLGYILLLAPFVYSVFYSMPANDDFALGINWWGGNIIVEAINRAAWNYLHWFGQSGLIAILIQVALNPLYWFGNAGHSFGICMVIVFLLITTMTIWGIRRLIKFAFLDRDDAYLDITTFLVALILFTTYYYNDVYNWWSGVPGYSLMIMFNVLACGFIAKYTSTHSKKDYVAMIIIGIITCTSLMNCVAMGLFYLFFVFIKHNSDKDSFVKKIVPFVLYVVSGIITVAAPGNYDRMEYERYFGYDVKDPQFIESAIITAQRVILRFVKTMAYKPWTMFLMLAIIAVGIYLGSKDKPRISLIILGAISVFISAFGAVYPYVLGSSKDLSADFANRIYFVEDYIVIIGLSLVAFRFGQWISAAGIFNMDKKRLGMSFAISIVLGVIITFVNPYTTTFIPADIVKNAALIKETYYFWDDILGEIANSEDKDVVVYRKDVDWCQYVYIVSLSSDGVGDWPVGDDIYYAGCNQAAAIFYGKDSIEVILE